MHFGLSFEQFERCTPRETSALFDVHNARESIGATRFGIATAAFYNAHWKRKDGREWTPEDFGAPKPKPKPKTEAELRLESLVQAVKARMAFRIHSPTRRFKSKAEVKTIEEPRRRRNRG